RRAGAAVVGCNGGNYTCARINVRPPVVKIGSIAAAPAGAALSRPTTARRLYRLIRHVYKVLVREPPAGRLELGGDVSHCRRHDVLAAKLPAEFIEILLVIDDGFDDVLSHSSACSG